MLFTYKDIDFDIDERNISKEECIKLFTPIIDIANKFNTKIVEINVEDDEYVMILIEGGDENNYSKNTMEYVEELRKYNIDTATSDEDYGELDAINIYF